MADDARQSLPDLATAPLSDRYDFFELLRRLERDGRVFGHAGRPEREPARLGQNIRLGFAVQDVAALTPEAEGSPARVTVSNFGLFGPEGPMPLHLTRWILDRLSQRWFAGSEARETSDTTFVDFANLLQHRMTALFYRAWADAHPEVQVERPVGGRIRAMLEALGGIGLPGTANIAEPALDAVRLRQAPALANQVESAERLTHFLAEALAVPVRLKEFVGAWISMPKIFQTRLGSAHAQLSRGATIGPRTFQRKSRIEVVLGPLGLEDYEAFLPGSRRHAVAKDAIRGMLGTGIDVDLRVVLRRAEVPAARLGKAKLSRTAWLAPPADGGDAEDFLLRTAVGWRPSASEAVA
jgi:type VI secretion system protein ImpH